MYVPTLIFKYLSRKLAPLFAAVAVTLCTMMVIVVISIMGGFLDMLRENIQRSTGDVIISHGMFGSFPHYDVLIERLEALPQVHAATPIIESFGLLNLTRAREPMPVRLIGIRPGSFSEVVPFGDNLVWSEQDMIAHLEREFPPEELDDPDLRDWYLQVRAMLSRADLRRHAMTLTPPSLWQPQETDAPALPGMVVGIEVNPFHTRDGRGQYDFDNSLIQLLSRRQVGVTLTTAPATDAGTVGAIRPNRRQFVVVNEIKSGHYEADSSHVYLSFDVLQAMMDMQAQEIWPEQQFDPDTGERFGDPVQRPARTTRVLVRSAPGYSASETAAAAREVVSQLHQDYPAMNLPLVLTWEQANARVLGAVQNEKGLVTFLFIIISVVAIVMVASTFYMIVLEKTRDIGTLRAIGASRWGILRIFVGYGLAIGIIGAACGFVLAWLIVTNINAIQDAVALLTGWRMWDPSIYAFDRIPGQLDGREIAAILAGAVISSMVGALVPAYLASRLDPIEALRYE